MTSLKYRLLGTLAGLENQYDELRFKFHQRMGLGEICVLPYMGYGDGKKVYVRGRLLQDRHISPAMEDDNWLENLLNTYKRYRSREIPEGLIRATFYGVDYDAYTDDEGYFRFEIEPKDALPNTPDGWHEIHFELIDYPGKEHNYAEPQTPRSKGHIIVPPDNAEFGIISDIDDTVMQTDVLNLLSMAKNTFFKNARTRLPFEGVSEFYKSLQKGVNGTRNPIYYISSSAWNLYDMLVDFFAVRGIPLGPLFLVDLGLSETTFITPSHHDHKVRAIETVLETHPKLKFILVGDSGQKDPEIYSDILKNYADRILAIYIRDITGERRDTQIGEIIKASEPFGVPMLTVPDTMAAAIHAAANGYMLSDMLPKVSEEVKEDKQAATPLEQALKPDAAPAASSPAADLVEKVEEVLKPENPPKNQPQAEKLAEKAEDVLKVEENAPAQNQPQSENLVEKVEDEIKVEKKQAAEDAKDDKV